MARWQDVLSLVANNAEEAFDTLKYRLNARMLCDRPLLIAAYRGYGTPDRLFVRGRVLQNRGVTSARDNDSTWRNLLNMYRRFDSNEVPRARVLARYGDVIQELITDEEGFFYVWLPTRPPLERDLPGRSMAPDGAAISANGQGRPADQLDSARSETPVVGPTPEEVTAGLWRQVDLELLEPQCADGQPVRAECFVLVPPPTARFAIISDIDDTVIHTDATHLLKMARTVFLGNARMRLPFEGVAAFYRALHEGAGENERNALFYVSNSPWNMYDLFSDFFQMQDIPIGPVMTLRDWGISRRKNNFAPLHARAYKTEAVSQFLEAYPNLPFILIGDSGEKDPEVYSEIVARTPERVLAVYIRNVSRKPARIQAIQKLAEQVVAAGSTLVLADNTLPLAEHALEHGWISPRALPRIKEARAADRQPPTPLEKLLGEQVQQHGPTVVIKDETPQPDAVEQALQTGDLNNEKPPTVVVKGDEVQKREEGNPPS